MPRTGHRCSKFSPEKLISIQCSGCEHYLLAWWPRTGRNLLDVKICSFLTRSCCMEQCCNIKYLSSLTILAIEVTFFPGPGMGHLAVWCLAAPGTLFCHDPGGCTRSISLLQCQSRHAMNWRKDIYFFTPYTISKKAVREQEAFCVYHLDITRKAAYSLCFSLFFPLAPC